MYPIEVNDGNFESQILQSERPVLVDFWAPWCSPCRVIGPTVEQLADELAGQFTVAKVNTESDPEWAGRFGVRAIPTLILFENGAELDRVVGAQPKWALRAWLEPHLED
jgi:thioredoxin 1